MSKFKPAYPRLTALGVSINNEPAPYIDTANLAVALEKASLSVEQFNKLFGIQTCIVIDGIGQPYPWDVEAVLERMMSGKLTGTQLIPD